VGSSRHRSLSMYQRAWAWALARSSATRRCTGPCMR